MGTWVGTRLPDEHLEAASLCHVFRKERRASLASKKIMGTKHGVKLFFMFFECWRCRLAKIRAGMKRRTSCVGCPGTSLVDRM